jgi:hypothetical protein
LIFASLFISITYKNVYQSSEPLINFFLGGSADQLAKQDIDEELRVYEELLNENPIDSDAEYDFEFDETDDPN